MLNEKFILSNGAEIPKIALGTWQISNEDVVNAVQVAIKIGYRHIDTAVGYGNERGVAQGIKESVVPREQIFITTKIPAEIKSYESAKETITKSLSDLNTAYIDLMLIHAPRPWSEMSRQKPNQYFGENLAVWKAMEEAHQDGKLKSIGVSNFIISDIENILENCAIKPTVNQICFHIGNSPEDILSYCNKNDILIMGYAPIATGKLLDNARIKEIAAKYGVSIPQICIKYLLQRNVLPIPKSVHEEYIRQNADMSFEISAADMQTLINF
jgi:diketogulonate reductase-like aldo/keto reductase